MCGEDAGAAKGLQPIHSRKADHHRLASGRCGLSFFVDAYPESDLAGFVEPSSVRAHRELLYLCVGALEVECCTLLAIPEENNVLYLYLVWCTTVTIYT